MYTIRQATIYDKEIILAIIEKAWIARQSGDLEKLRLFEKLGELNDVGNISQLISDKVRFFLLIEESTGTVGFVSWSSTKKKITIHQIYCLPETQGKGYIKILINEVVEIALASGCESLDLYLSDHNMQRNYYERLGFYPVESKNDNQETDPQFFLMRKKIR